jgi:hypothetical protein
MYNKPLPMAIKSQIIVPDSLINQNQSSKQDRFLTKSQNSKKKILYKFVYLVLAKCLAAEFSCMAGWFNFGFI